MLLHIRRRKYYCVINTNLQILNELITLYYFFLMETFVQAKDVPTAGESSNLIIRVNVYIVSKISVIVFNITGNLVKTLIGVTTQPIMSHI